MGPSGCHFQALLPKGNFLAHLETVRKSQRTGEEGRGKLLDLLHRSSRAIGGDSSSGCFWRFIVINVFQSMVLPQQNLTHFSVWKKVFLILYGKAFHLSSLFIFFFEPGGDANDSFFFFKFHFFSTVVIKSCYIYKLLLLMLFQVFNGTILMRKIET